MTEYNTLAANATLRHPLTPPQHAVKRIIALFIITIQNNIGNYIIIDRKKQ